MYYRKKMIIKNIPPGFTKKKINSRAFLVPIHTLPHCVIKVETCKF